MAVEVGDWVRGVGVLGEGEVTEVRGEKATVAIGVRKLLVTVPVAKLRIASRPQTGHRR